MPAKPSILHRLAFTLQAAAFCLLAAAACGRSSPDRLQGYIEGEFLYIAAPSGGSLKRLHTKRGDAVIAGAPLFDLDDEQERAARDEAASRLSQAQALLQDLRKGLRPSELEALSAQLRQTRAALEYSEREYTRQESLVDKAVPKKNLDRARAMRDRDRARTAELEWKLITAELGARPDQISAAEAHETALRAALDQAEWSLKQKHQTAPQAGLVFDTMFNEGEWVPASRPVVMLLPPRNIKVRAFVPENELGRLKVGQRLEVHIDGRTLPAPARLTFISPRAEFTPPVIYSNENRAKLVFMIEAEFEPGAEDLHPGQPADIQF